jgi:hypothetical protein
MRKFAAVLAAATVTFAAFAPTAASADPRVDHVLLLSLDGFHDFDLTNYVRTHPHSALARVVAEGQRYSDATTQVPSDSFPTTLAMTTGGSPRSTGVYYDDTYDHDLYPAGSNCTGPIGTEVAYKQNINFDKNFGSTVADINPKKLPLDPANGCTPVYPHQYLKVNTIYEVAHAAGRRTAVADKHPAYEILNGPSGTGVDDFYGPEFYPAKSDITKIMANDELKVDAVLNQIDGYTSQDNAHTDHVGVPAIFGMNFQSPNIGQKLSGYADPSGMAPEHITTLGDPSTWKAPGLAQALDYVDGAVGRMLAELDAKGLSDDTMIIVTAKHGNSPVDRSSLQWVDPATISNLINDNFPGALGLVTADTMPLIWLKDQSKTADVAALLQAHAAEIGAATITSGADVGTLFGGQLGGNPSRIPDIVIQGAPGVLYDTGTKLVDHGSGSVEDTHVPLVVVAPGVQGGVTLNCPVSLRQVAPSILQALGLNPKSLDAVRLEGTKALPNGPDCG